MSSRKAGFVLLGELGRGNFGVAEKVKRKTDGKVCVWKRISMNHIDWPFTSNFKTWRALPHPAPIRLKCMPRNIGIKYGTFIQKRFVVLFHLRAVDYQQRIWLVERIPNHGLPFSGVPFLMSSRPIYVLTFSNKLNKHKGRNWHSKTHVLGGSKGGGCVSAPLETKCKQ